MGMWEVSQVDITATSMGPAAGKCRGPSSYNKPELRHCIFDAVTLLAQNAIQAKHRMTFYWRKLQQFAQYGKFHYMVAVWKKERQNDD